MELPWNLHPLAVWNRFDLAFALLLQDQDLRFPEVRRRLSLEIKLRSKAILPELLTPQVLEVLNKVTSDFDHQNEVLSVFELFYLLEWNERYLQAFCVLQILECHSQKTLLPLDTAMRERFQWILEEILENPLSIRPSWVEVLSFRWKFSTLRAEVHYLLDLKNSSKLL